MSDAELLAAYVETWWQALGDVTDLLEALPTDAWDLPTDLAGWDVRAVASHIAHLERVLATGEEETADIGEPAHVRSPMGQYTEIGVVNRRQQAPEVLIAGLREHGRQRYDALRADLPTDASAQPERIFGGVPWDWGRLLRNRVLDVWMHEQDIRRAVGDPGGMESAAAQHTADYLTEAFGYVVGKRVGPPAGTTAVLDVEGSRAVAVEVDESGRARRLPQSPAAPIVRLGMDRPTFIVLAGGRRPYGAPGADAVTVDGDADLGRRILEQLGTTP